MADTNQQDESVTIGSEVDDERRSLPEDWVRAFDRNSGHHFYAHTAHTLPSSWIHPYDNAKYLSSISPDHPASPSSNEAQFFLRKAAEEQARNDQAGMGEKKAKNGFLAGLKKAVTGEEDGRGYEERKAIKEAEENFIKRRMALQAGDTSAVGTKKRYAPDPFAYPAPVEPFYRPTTTQVQYAYGYPGGYQRKYTPALGYDKMAKDRSMLDTAVDSIAVNGNFAPGFSSKKTGYGFSG